MWLTFEEYIALLLLFKKNNADGKIAEICTFGCEHELPLYANRKNIFFFVFGMQLNEFLFVVALKSSLCQAALWACVIWFVYGRDLNNIINRIYKTEDEWKLCARTPVRKSILLWKYDWMNKFDYKWKRWWWVWDGIEHICGVYCDEVKPKILPSCISNIYAAAVCWWWSTNKTWTRVEPNKPFRYYSRNAWNFNEFRLNVVRSKNVHFFQTQQWLHNIKSANSN